MLNTISRFYMGAADAFWQKAILVLIFTKVLYLCQWLCYNILKISRTGTKEERVMK